VEGEKGTMGRWMWEEEDEIGGGGREGERGQAKESKERRS
jgi:hypothetical protein